MTSNREKLIQAAADLFHRQGYQGTGIEEVLVQSGVARSNLYYHFESKTALALAVVEHWIGVYDREIVGPALADTRRPPRERLLALFERAARTQRPGAGQTGCPLGRLGADVAGTEPAVRRMLTGYFDRVRQQLASLLHRTDPPGLSKAQASRHAAILTCLLEGGLLLSHIQADPDQVRIPGRAMVDLILPA